MKPGMIKLWKTLPVIAIIFVLLGVTPVNAATKVNVDGLEFKIIAEPNGDNSGQAILTRCEEPTTNDLKIPAQFMSDGKIFSVTAIADTAFWACVSLQSVTIPETVTSIGVNAFSDCSSLKKVIILGDVLSIGNNAFYCCNRLTTVEYRGTISPTCGVDVFEGTKVESVKVTVNYQGADFAGKNKEIIKCTTCTEFYSVTGKCTMCGAVCSHKSYTDGVCDVCGYVCIHVTEMDVNKATCAQKAKCDRCGTNYGELEGHSFDAIGKCSLCDYVCDHTHVTASNNGATHSFTCSICHAEVIGQEHNYTYDAENHKCICGDIETYSISINGDGGVKIVSVNGIAVTEDKTITVEHGKKLTITLVNVASEIYNDIIFDAVYIGENCYYFHQEEYPTINDTTLTFDKGTVTDHVKIEAYAYVSVMVNMGGGIISSQGSEEFVEKNSIAVLNDNYNTVGRSIDINLQFVNNGHILVFTKDQNGKIYDRDYRFYLTNDLYMTLVWQCAILTKVEANAATCTAIGNIEHWKCEYCGKLYIDSEGNKEITDVSYVVVSQNADAHSYPEFPNSYINNVDTHTEHYICSYDVSHIKDVSGVGHIYIDSVCACGNVCDHIGNTNLMTDKGDGKHIYICSICGESITEYHSFEYSVDGTTIAVSCSANCGYSGAVTISAIGKTYDGNAVVVNIDKIGAWENTEIGVSYTKDGESFTGELVSAGNYTASITLGDQTVCTEFTIAKANYDYVEPLGADILLYDPLNEQKLLIDISANAGLIRYKLGETGEWSYDEPTAKDPGTYTIYWEIEERENYNGAFGSVTATILSLELQHLKTTVTVEGKACLYNGMSHTPDVSVAMDYSTDIPIYTLIKGVDYTVYYENNVNAGTATVIIVGRGGFDGILTKTFEIEKATPTYSVPIDLTAIYGDTLGDVWLPEGFRWQNAISTIVGNVGRNTFKVTYTPANQDNYKFLTDIEVTITVAPKIVYNPVIEGIDDYYIYVNNAIVPVPTAVKDCDLVIPSDEYTVEYVNNAAIGTATLKIVDVVGGNYTICGSVTFAIVGHSHMWHFTAENDIITANCIGEIGTCDVHTVTIKLNAPEALIYDGTEKIVAVTQYPAYLFEDVATEIKGGWINVGKYTASLTFGGVAATLNFEIEKAEISTVEVSVTTPDALGQKQTTVDNDTGYTATIEWDTDAEIFGFNTAYTAIVTLVPDSNHKFADGIVVEGWITQKTDDFLTLIKTFENTRKEKLTNLTYTFSNMVLGDHHTEVAGAIAEMPATVSYDTESGCVTVNIEWDCENYNSAPQVINVFVWTVKAGELASYDENCIATSGSIAVTNADARLVNNICMDQEIIYNGETYDVSAMFIIDENAGAESYAIVDGGTGAGILDGSVLTITKAGTINIKLTTAANDIYAASEDTVILTVNKGAGSGSVTIEGWIYGDSPAVPVAVNGKGKVTFKYNTIDGEVPVNAGSYIITAIFAATDLYEETTATAAFTISQATPTLTVPEFVTAQFGETLADIVLNLSVGDTDGRWIWNDPETTLVGNVGEKQFNATFKPTDSINYKNIEVKLRVVVSCNHFVIDTTTYKCACGAHVVAKIDDYHYNNLEKAIEAAQRIQRCTVKMLVDVMVENSIYINSGDFTIDLNGKKITLSNGNSYLFVLCNQSRLKLIDTGMGGTVEAEAPFTLTGSSHLAVESGMIHATNYEAVSLSFFGNATQATLNVSGGVLKSDSYNVITAQGNSVTISGGELIHIDNYNDIYYLQGLLDFCSYIGPVGIKVYLDSNATEINITDTLGVYCWVDINGKVSDPFEAGSMYMLKKLITFDCVNIIGTYTYTGGEIIPTVIVTHNENHLEPGFDYKVSYYGNVNAGIATVEISGQGDCVGKVNAQFEIEKAPADFFSETVLGFVANCTTTELLLPNLPPEVEYREIICPANISAIVDGDKLIAIGTNVVSGALYMVKVKVTSKNYEDYYVNAILAGEEIVILGAEGVYTYFATPIIPVLTLTFKGIKLIEGVDYILIYHDNINAGIATVTVQFMGNYFGTITRNFTIMPREVSIAWSNTTIEFNGRRQTPTATAYGVLYGDICVVGVSGWGIYDGTYTATASSLSNPNYALPESRSCQFTIWSDSQKVAKDTVGDIIDVIPDSFKDSISNSISNAIDGAVSGVTDATGKVVSDAVSDASEVVDNVASAVTEAASQAFANALMNFFESLVQRFGSIFG